MTSRNVLTPHLVVILYLVVVAAAEIVLVFANPIWGMLAHATLFLILLLHYLLQREAIFRTALPPLSLIPLLRILSLTMTSQDVPVAFWYALIGAPMAVAVIQACKLLGLSPGRVGLRLRVFPAQLLITLSGVPLGIAGTVLLASLRQPLLVDRSERLAVFVAAASVVLFGGLLEELIFRGMLQRILYDILGWASLLYSSTLFAVAYIGTRSPGYLVFIWGVGLYFGWAAQRTKSIWGVAMAHSVMILCMLLIGA